MAQRLKSLHYNVVLLSKTVTFSEDAEPIEATLNGFRCVATSSTLTAEPEDDYHDEAEAQSALHDALGAWSATSELIDMSPIAFEFQGASYETVSEDGSDVTAHVLIDTLALTDTVTAVVTKSNLPTPHTDIAHEGPAAAQLRRRWRNVVRGTESPIAVAYVVQTTAENYVHGQDKISNSLNISAKVWKRLHKLTSTDDPMHGRKANGWPGSITDDDLNWIKYACPLIIRRLLEHEAGADISRRITNDDLPRPALAP